MGYSTCAICTAPVVLMYFPFGHDGHKGEVLNQAQGRYCTVFAVPCLERWFVCVPAHLLYTDRPTSLSLTPPYSKVA